MRNFKSYLYIGVIVLFCSNGIVFANEMPTSLNQTANQSQIIKPQEKNNKQSEAIYSSKEPVRSGQKSFQGPQGQQYGMPHSGYELKRWW